MFLFILFITYSFHYLFAKTGRAVQGRLAGDGRAATESPCPGHSRSDTDGDRTPRADHAAGTEAGGLELAQQSRLRALQASPKGKALLLHFPCCRRLLLCSLPRASPVGTNQPFYATSRRSIPAPAPEQAPRARHPGAGPNPRLRFLPRATSCHGPITPCQSPTPSGFSPAPHGAALAYPHTVFLRCLPPCTVFLLPPWHTRTPCALARPQLAGSMPPGDVPVTVLAAMAWCPRTRTLVQGKSIALATQAPHQRGRSGSGFHRDAGAFPRQHRVPRPGRHRAPCLCPCLYCK